MLYGIPSYQRAASIKTPSTLITKLGIPAESIIVQLQTEEDYEAYKEVLPAGVQVQWAPAHNAAGNRNGILRSLPLGTEIVLLDDDIRDFTYNSDPTEGKPHGTTQRHTPETFQAMVADGFRWMNERGFTCWGIYASHNNVFMRGKYQRRGNYEINDVLSGQFFALKYTGELFDETVDLMEDVEFSLRLIKRDGGNLKLTLHGVSSEPMKKNPGGCKDFYDKADYTAACAKRVYEEYKPLVRLDLESGRELSIEPAFRYGETGKPAKRQLSELDQPQQALF